MTAESKLPPHTTAEEMGQWRKSEQKRTLDNRLRQERMKRENDFGEVENLAEKVFIGMFSRSDPNKVTKKDCEEFAQMSFDAAFFWRELRNKIQSNYVGPIIK